MLSRFTVLLAVILCSFFLYEGIMNNAGNHKRKLPAPLPVATEKKLLGTEKEYLALGRNPAFQQAVPKQRSQKKAATKSTLISLVQKIALKGIINAPGKQNDRAIIADQTTGKESLLRIGDKIYGLTVIRITRKSVTLQAKSGKFELTYAT